MEGFSTFLEPTEVDFTEVDLVALVGPTGSGKSSIIDAITFALYGSVSRYHDARLVAPVINQRANEARVRLDFELGGREYAAVRVIRRTRDGRATTREARLEVITELDDDRSPVLASGAKELTEAVENLLGLDFAQFTRTVVLPQGEFAEFLTDDPANRQKLLRRLLDIEVYARMGSLAREQAKAAAQQAEVLEGQLARYTELTPALLVVQQALLDQLDGFGPVAVDLLDRLNRSEIRLVELRAAVSDIDADLARVVLIEVPKDMADRGETLAALRLDLEQARAALAAARIARQQAIQAVAAAAEPAAIEAALLGLRRMVELSTDILELSTEETTAQASVHEALAALAKAEVVAEQAADGLRTARLGADAAAWSSSLVAGEQCPVCRQTVTVVPDHDPSAELAAAVAAAKSAAASVDELRVRANVTTTAAHTVRARLEVRRNEHDALGRSMATVDLEEMPQLERQLDHARALAATAKGVEAAVASAERAAVDAESRLEQGETADRRLRLTFSSQRDAVAPLGPPPAAGVSLVADWAELQSWGEVTQKRREADRLAVAEEGRAVAASKADLLGDLAAGTEPLGLAPEPASLPASLARLQAATEAEIARLSERLAELDEWRVDASGLRNEQRVNESLGRQLAAGGFEGWLLTEALEDLVDRASVRLQELSNGQYSLAAQDRTFRIVDHNNAGEQRDVRTLSGGETFLASLALALALADSIRDLAPVDTPRLGSMVLDEGFGTLDAETLDVVASTIEELSTSGRLVGVVTHIEALAERMPVRYLVSKGVTSSSVERVLS